jgi:hypothetical protein
MRRVHRAATAVHALADRHGHRRRLAATANSTNSYVVLRVSAGSVGAGVTRTATEAGFVSWWCGPLTVQMLYTAPPGLTVMVGHSPGEGPRPQNTNWLTVTVTVADGLAAVSVPDAGDTLTRPSGSPATVTDQLTVPPAADSWIGVPGPPG